MSSSAGRAVVYGGGGALGRACIGTFKEKGWWVCSVDLSANDSADVNVVVSPDGDLTKQADQVASGVKNFTGTEKVDAIVCVAGGWAGGNASSADFVKNTDLVLKQSVWTSVISSRLAAEVLKDGGFLLLTGAAPALQATPGMMGYGLAKAAVHHLVKSLAADKSGLPTDAGVAALLPKILDWSAPGSANRPSKGALVKVVTKGGNTDFIEV